MLCWCVLVCVWGLWFVGLLVLGFAWMLFWVFRFGVVIVLLLGLLD